MADAVEERNDPNPLADSYAEPLDVHRTLQRVLLYGILPLWVVPGFVDYVFHRKTHIESTSGTHESLIHGMQMTSIGIPTLIGLLCEVNAGTIAIAIGLTAVHEALTVWDVAYAEPLRRPTPNEQHTHSFLEVTPLMALMSMLTLHPQQTAALFGRGDTPPRWGLRPKTPPLSRRYVAGILGLITLLVALPYGEEFMRCYRADRTFAPHTPSDESPDEPPVA